MTRLIFGSAFNAATVRASVKSISLFPLASKDIPVAAIRGPVTSSVKSAFGNINQPQCHSSMGPRTFQRYLGFALLEISTRTFFTTLFFFYPNRHRNKYLPLSIWNFGNMSELRRFHAKTFPIRHYLQTSMIFLLSTMRLSPRVFCLFLVRAKS